jgi:hypothetical protein
VSLKYISFGTVKTSTKLVGVALTVLSLFGSAMAMIALVGYILVYIVIGPHSIYLNLVIIIVGLLVSMFLLVLVHETGHLFAALCFGFNVSQVRIWPLLFARENNKWRLRFVWSRRIPAGYVQANLFERGLRRFPMAIFVCCGPLANLLVALACLFFAIEFNGKLAATDVQRDYLVEWIADWFSPDNELSRWLNLVAFQFLIFGFGSFVPYQKKRSLTDGAVLLGVIDGRGLNRDLILQRLATQLVAGTRPRDLNAPLVEQMLALRLGDDSDVLANLYGYYHAIDLGAIDRAGKLISLAIDQQAGYPPERRSWLYLEAAFYYAWIRKKPVIARSWLNQAMPGQAEAQAWCRAESAILDAERKFEVAVKRAEEGLAAAAKSADPGGVKLEIDLLKMILDESRKCALPAICPMPAATLE